MKTQICLIFWILESRWFEVETVELSALVQARGEKKRLTRRREGREAEEKNRGCYSLAKPREAQRKEIPG